MTTKERIELTLKHQEADRIPITDTIWGPTIERWKQEGLPNDKGPWDYFGFDGWAAMGADISLQLPTETIEDTEDYIISRNSDGAVTL
jgi:hypothetical protein